MAKSVTFIQEVMSDLSLVTVPESYKGEIDYKEGDYVQCDLKVIKTAKGKRSALMNNCVHKYCEMVAFELNVRHIDAGLNIVNGNQSFALPTPWTMILVKERIFKVMLEAVSGNSSTAKATDKDLCEVEDKLGKYFAESMGIVIEWPTSQPPVWR